MSDKPEIILCEPVRTAIGGYGGAFKDFAATELGAAVVREALVRAGSSAEQVSTVVLGNVIQAGNRMNPARQASVNGGVPVSVPALTVNRVCGSGAQALLNAAQEIAFGAADVVVAGGMENMDRAPYLLPNGRWGARMGNVEILDSMLHDGLVDAFSSEHSGWHTEDLVSALNLTREEQDRWAERSQQRFASAQAAGKFSDEIVSVEIKGRKGIVKVDKDEHPRPDTTYEMLSKLRPAFRKDGTITAGNAPGLNSGAAAMVVASRSIAEKRNLNGVARLAGYGLAAVEPGMFGLGPVPAIEQALVRAGWSLGNVERVEINEAFAAVPLAVAKKLHLDHEIINVEGGAIAHGHPIGATGAVLTTRLIHSMRRDGLKRGLVSLCIGGGQGIALAIELI
ncbi:acetyl-CoA C-acetyltransferase [Paraburkholderia sp. GAS199]|uniref:acetyl-CoA C-acetyltransferase n=1 Tax=Paraburkholderia sp. GAS199 TaxID=3035126 RepID=UPI003D230843